MTSEAPPAHKQSGLLIWGAIFLIAAGAFLALPIFDCNLCMDLRKSIKVSDANAIDCPCCGHSMKLSLFHRLLPAHRKHLDDFHKALEGL